MACPTGARRRILECISVRYTFSLLRDSGVAHSGDWVGGLQWTALLYTHSSRRCAAPRLLSPKPSRGLHRPRLNLPSRARGPNPLSRLGRPSRSAATRDGWPPAEWPCLPRGFLRKRQNSERPVADRRDCSRQRSHLCAAGAMIGGKSVPVSTGYGELPRPGPALGEEQVPTYSFGGGPHRAARRPVAMPTHLHFSAQ